MFANSLKMGIGFVAVFNFQFLSPKKSRSVGLSFSQWYRVSTVYALFSLCKPDDCFDLS
jgi:hypothetical protein